MRVVVLVYYQATNRGTKGIIAMRVDRRIRRFVTVGLGGGLLLGFDIRLLQSRRHLIEGVGEVTDFIVAARSCPSLGLSASTTTK